MARIDEDAYSKFQLIYCWGDSHGNRAAGNTSTLMNPSQTSCSTTGNPVFSYLCGESTMGTEPVGVLKAGGQTTVAAIVRIFLMNIDLTFIALDLLYATFGECLNKWHELYYQSCM